jgi:3,4-dihydroxy 2-butanone 4-phosphate synthase/GTP cyclohydrolase II
MDTGRTRTDAVERVLRAIEDIREGRMVILVDDEDRENEGDLVMAASAADARAVNFMAKHARGLICLSMTEQRIQQLDLPMMVEDNRAPRRTAFTVSIEARHGVTTGISAADRAHTIATAVDPEARPSDLVSPGHVFPLKSRPGGVLQRTGHTEGSVDLARLAGLEPAGVICEIMREDGTMARYPDLLEFAEQHELRILSIADLIQYRMHTEQMVHCAGSSPIQLPSGTTWQAHVYETSVDDRQLLALTLGEVGPEPTLVRVHTGSILGDVFGVRSRSRMVMADVIERIERAGAGVILFFPGTVNLARDLAFHSGQEIERRIPEQGEVLREYGLGAQVLADLGLGRIRILTSRPRRIPSLEGYGLEVVEQLLLEDPDTHTDQPPSERTTH